MQSRKQPVVILLIEDNPLEQRLVQQTLQKRNDEIILLIVSSGEEAIKFLTNESEYTDRNVYQSADLILLDLGLPGKIDGKAILKFVRKNNILKVKPVIILTSSTDPKIVQELYRLGANAYICKQCIQTNFEYAMNLIVEFWFEINIMPPHLEQSEKD